MTSFELQEQGLQFMCKRLQTFESETPGYFQFLNNLADPIDVHQQIQEDIQHNKLWTLYSKKPWESFEKVQYGNKKQEMLHKDLHIECIKGDSTKLMSMIRNWIKSKKAKNKFGENIKVIEVLPPSTHPVQIERTVRMNGHGRRFQNIIDMVELCGLNVPNGVVAVKNKKYSVRQLILEHRTSNTHPVFLSVTKNGDPHHGRQHIYYRKGKNAIDFAENPAAWLSHNMTKLSKQEMFKHFDPDIVQEEIDSEWD